MKREFTASTYVIWQEQVLLLFHPKIKKWLPPGGHLEKNETPSEAAMREVLEETGIEIEWIADDPIWIKRWNAKSFPRPYLCLIEEIPIFGNQEAHQHLDFVYLARPKSEIFQIKTEENHPIRWFTLEEIISFEDDVEIFAETKQVLHTIFQRQCAV